MNDFLNKETIQERVLKDIFRYFGIALIWGAITIGVGNYYKDGMVVVLSMLTFGMLYMRYYFLGAYSVYYYLKNMFRSDTFEIINRDVSVFTVIKNDNNIILTPLVIVLGPTILIFIIIPGIIIKKIINRL